MADDPLEFAKAAVAALGDARLWEMLSAEGLRHQRVLCPARQSAVLGGALRQPLLIESPAEQAQLHALYAPALHASAYMYALAILARRTPLAL